MSSSFKLFRYHDNSLLYQVVIIFTAGWFNAGEQVHEFVRTVAKLLGDTIRIRMVDVEEAEVLDTLILL
jgi:hypothetical protein